MDSKGQHLIIDAYECQSDILNSAEQLRELLTNTINDLGMEILSTHFHSFTPQGVTGVIGISTSHFSVHTWPEHGYAALDLYTCGDQEIGKALKGILEKLEAKRAEVYELSRGEESHSKSTMKKLILAYDTDDAKNETTRELFQLKDDKGNPWDMLLLKEMVKGNHDILFDGSSQFQDIVLVKANDLRLYLDQELQFSSLDERYYHEALIYPAMELAASHERVLILGGGDGLGLREVLKYPNVKHVDLVDIDPVIIELAKTEPALLALNNRSFLDKRVHVHIEDAKQYIAEELQPYDVIIVDFPDPVNEILSSLYTKEVFSQITSHLSKDGVLVCQSNSSEDAPKTYWSIAHTIQSAGLHTKAYNLLVPSFGLWGFHLAAYKEFTENIPEISVPHQALSKNIESLFQIPADVTKAKRACHCK